MWFIAPRHTRIFSILTPDFISQAQDTFTLILRMNYRHKICPHKSHCKSRIEKYWIVREGTEMSAGENDGVHLFSPAGVNSGDSIVRLCRLSFHQLHIHLFRMPIHSCRIRSPATKGSLSQ